MIDKVELKIELMRHGLNITKLAGIVEHSVRLTYSLINDNRLTITDLDKIKAAFGLSDQRMGEIFLRTAEEIEAKAKTRPTTTD